MNPQQIAQRLLLRSGLHHIFPGEPFGVYLDAINDLERLAKEHIELGDCIEVYVAHKFTPTEPAAGLYVSRRITEVIPSARTALSACLLSSISASMWQEYGAILYSKEKGSFFEDMLHPREEALKTFLDASEYTRLAVRFVDAPRALMLATRALGWAEICTYSCKKKSSPYFQTAHARFAASSYEFAALRNYRKTELKESAKEWQVTLQDFPHHLPEPRTCLTAAVQLATIGRILNDQNLISFSGILFQSAYNAYPLEVEEALLERMREYSRQPITHKHTCKES